MGHPEQRNPHQPSSVFIDGSSGTTGLRIAKRLQSRPDIQLITLPEALRKDESARAEALNSADVAILCLPDAAALEASALVENDHTVIIDASTAHRTAPGWDYGFPEIHGARAALAHSRRISNPGCHASGFIALVAPLVSAGVLPATAALTCMSLTGYSGGGKKMIAEYEAPSAAAQLAAPRAYGLGQHHKHIPEMMQIAQLHTHPTFVPVVANFYAGLEVIVPIPAGLLSTSAREILDLYSGYYAGEPLIHVDTAGISATAESGFLNAAAFAGRDDLSISVHTDEQESAGAPLTLVARCDNLGKGASGAAIQNLNIAIGAPETTGLRYAS
ncbi:MAG: N-acetyl-gamma-glutamyl-phosphate reductase [Arcanobacterium sp.]|nr:N-acetyl-gamma-glutamyl-phosphate reductase [Arcanobacterium sp.]